MRILLVKLKHIGDALLMTPVISALRKSYPDCFITVLVRRGTEGILKGCSAIDRIVTTVEPEPDRRRRMGWLADLKSFRELRALDFDYAFELSDNSRGRWMAGFSGAGRRCLNEAHRPVSWFWKFCFSDISLTPWKELHRVEKDYNSVRERIELPDEPPELTYEEAGCQEPEGLCLHGDFAVIHPATRWRRKQWPAERWVEAGLWLTRRGMQVVVSAGPDPDEIALAGELAGRIGAGALSTGGKLRWNELAWLFYRSRLFIGVDTAAMHLAAACRCPTVALFGATKSSAWGPWKTVHRVVGPAEPGPPKTADLAERHAYLERATSLIPVAHVIKAAGEILS